MDGGGHIIVFVTVGTDAEAAKTRDVLLEARQAACVSILSNVSSAYCGTGASNRLPKACSMFEDNE